MKYKNVELKSEFDLIYFDEYRTATDDVRKEAHELFRSGASPDEVLRFCAQKTMYKKAQKLKREANLGKRFENRTFKTFKIRSQAQRNAYYRAFHYSQNIDRVLRRGTGIVFAGNGHVGTGKTHLACAIANDLLDRGYPVKVINVTQMIYQIKSDFKVEEFIDVPILLVDDLGKEIGTPWVAETLYHIFNARYEAMRPTIITTEYGLEEVKQNYDVKVHGKEYSRGNALVSRLSEDFMYVIMDWDDYRQR